MNVLYAILYFVVVTPLGTLLRFSGYDPLQLKRGGRPATAFKTRNDTFTKTDFEAS